MVIDIQRCEEIDKSRWGRVASGQQGNGRRALSTSLLSLMGSSNAWSYFSTTNLLSTAFCIKKKNSSTACTHRSTTRILRGIECFPLSSASTPMFQIKGLSLARKRKGQTDFLPPNDKNAPNPQLPCTKLSPVKWPVVYKALLLCDCPFFNDKFAPNWKTTFCSKWIVNFVDQIKQANRTQNAQEVTEHKSKETFIEKYTFSHDDPETVLQRNEEKEEIIWRIAKYCLWIRGDPWILWSQENLKLSQWVKRKP